MTPEEQERQEQLARIDAYFAHMFEDHPVSLWLAVVGAISVVVSVAWVLKVVATGGF